MLFDSHAHLNSDQFEQDREALIEALPSQGVSHVLIPGADVASSRLGLELSRKYPNVYCAAGVHPGEIEAMTRDDIDRIAEIASDPKCVAVGEIGLDYHYGLPEMRDTQRYWFYQQLNLAKELHLPVIVHDREAHQECFDAVRKMAVRGVFHCYSSSAEMAVELVKIGFYCSFTGVITYQGAKRAIRAIEQLPIERILIETDSPYLAPVPYQKQRNDPSHVRSVAEVIARIKGISTEEVARITAENTARLFKIEL